MTCSVYCCLSCHPECVHTAKALLKEQETQHPECQRLYRWRIEGCGLTTANPNSRVTANHGRFPRGVAVSLNPQTNPIKAAQTAPGRKATKKNKLTDFNRLFEPPSNKQHSLTLNSPNPCSSPASLQRDIIPLTQNPSTIRNTQ